MFHSELLMIRGLEKNNEGENLTKHETKNSGEQWRTQDLAKGSHNRGSGGKALSRQRPRGSGGVAPAANKFLRFSH